ncbi:tetratricopeptide repeat protein [bacterium]|nr:tetratricopeptide repeat protein [bacterium]
MEMIPEDFDICVSLDLDEVMRPGWKENILKVWNDNTTRLHYTYNWLIENNVAKISFYSDKIHKRKGAFWVNPVHEIVKFHEPETIVTTDDVIIDHYPDKNKSRKSYLPLLELSIKEDPQNDRNMHYLGREYMYYGKWNDAIDTLIKHLKMKSATWSDERCASMRFIARCYKNLQRYDEALMWLEKAIKEAPYLRDPYAEIALLYYSLEDYKMVIYYANKALEINYNPKTYINEIFSYDETLNDILSISYYYENDLNNAIKNANIALEINPNNERIKENLIIFKNQKNTEN